MGLCRNLSRISNLERIWKIALFLISRAVTSEQPHWRPSWPRIVRKTGDEIRNARDIRGSVRNSRNLILGDYFLRQWNPQGNSKFWQPPFSMFLFTPFPRLNRDVLHPFSLSNSNSLHSQLHLISCRVCCAVSSPRLTLDSVLKLLMTRCPAKNS